MRRWWLALAFVPVVAWGECYDAGLRSDLIEYAMILQDLEAGGIDEREVLNLLSTGEMPEVQAALYEVVRLVYGPMDVSISSIVTSAQNACYRQANH